MPGDNSDPEWVPPAMVKSKPKNFAMLEAKRKKAKKKRKSEYRCDVCQKKFVDGPQLQNHKRQHGR